MMHREFVTDIIVRRIDEACAPVVDRFLFSSTHDDGGGSNAAATVTERVSLYGLRWSAGAFYDSELRGVIGISDTTYSKGAKVFIFVDPAWRRKGIALALIEAAKIWAVDQGIHNLMISCARSDWPIRSLLEKIDARFDLIFDEIVARVLLHHADDVPQPDTLMDVQNADINNVSAESVRHGAIPGRLR